MKKTFWSLAIIFVFAFACFAQDGDAMKKTDTTEQMQTQTQTGTEFSAELLNKIDTEKSKRNDDFQLRLSEDVKIGDKTLEKGTKINGRVVRSKKTSKDDNTSLVSLYIGSVQEGDNYFRFNATVISVTKAETVAGEEMEFSSSPSFRGATIIKMKGKNLRFDEGTMLKLKVDDQTN